MQNRLRTIAISTFGLITIFNFTIWGQEQSSFIKIDQYGGRKVPKSLLNLVSVNLNEVPFEQALSTIAAEGNFKLNFIRNRVSIHKEVSVSMENAYALEALMKVLDATETELLITSEGQLVIVSSKQGEKNRGSITGQVIDAKTKYPLSGANISLVGMNIGGASGPNGRFLIEKIPFGNYTVQFSYIGYEIKRFENIRVDENTSNNLIVELTPQTLLLKAVTVTPGQFSILGKGPSVQQALSKKDLQTIPFGEDIYRAITRLPGISSSDFSAKFTVRGGEHEEVLVMLDGFELYEPFHLKDIEGGALSIIDIAAIEGIDLLTGGFPAEYGDRMSGVFNIKSTRAPEGGKRTSLGLSFMNARLMSEGTFNNNKGSWLFSARRGYLDLIMDLMGEEEPPRPVYYDVLSKIEYQFNAKHTLSAHFLHAGDRLDFVEDDDDEDNTRYGNTYGWLTFKYIPSSKLFIQSIASVGKLNHDREGIGYTGDLENIDFIVNDERDVDLYGFKQDWQLDISDRWFLKWGFDFKNFSANYDYLNTNRKENWIPPDSITAWMDTTQVNLNPSGRKFGAYFSNRFQIFSPLTAELGLRYDYNSYTQDKHFSPRFNLVYALGKQTFLRGGWGYFYQSQGIHEIRVNDGYDSFFTAELAKHWVAGLEHTFRNGFNVRVEGYYKDLSDLHPDFRNWSNEMEIFPEVQNDRFKLNFRGATSKGIELYLKYDRGGKFTWWSSYALAYAEEDIRNLIYEGEVYTRENSIYPGKRDQRHTFYLDLNYRPNRKWHFNLAWQFHTGWPHSKYRLHSVQGSDGNTYYFGSYDDYNDAKYPAYHRLDLRINRYFYTSRGRISVFLSLMNLYNRGNVRSVDYNWHWDDRLQRPYLVEEREYWFKLLPSIGFSWDFNH